jgi:succinate dehydrogenase/fumarate reductase flavoprotein subunit
VKAGDLHELMRVAESRSLLLVGELMARAALYRKESRMKPFHCRLDYPETDETNWRGLVLIRNEQGLPVTSFQKLSYKGS